MSPGISALIPSISSLFILKESPIVSLTELGSME
jgi:hypothetical protein